MSMFQCGAGYTDRLDSRRLVLGTRLDGHKLLTSVGGRNKPTACTVWLRMRILFKTGGLLNSTITVRKLACRLFGCKK